MYDNDECVDAFVFMAYMGGSEDEDKKSNDSEFQQHSGDLDDSVINSNLCAWHPGRNAQPNPRRHPAPNSDVNPISDTQILYHALLRSSMRIKKGHVDNSI